MNIKKWSPSLIKLTKGCKREFELTVNQSPEEVYVTELEEGIKNHENIESFLKYNNINAISNLPQKAQQQLHVIKKEFTPFETEKILQNDKIFGIADFISEQKECVTIIDFKSRYNSNIEEDDKIQLYTYASLVNTDKPIKIGIFAIYNAFSPLKIETLNMSQKDLQLYVEHQIELAEKRIPKMKINTSRCKFCKFIISCDYTTQNNNPENTIENIARKYIRIKELLKRYEYILRNYVELTGKNIIVDNIELGMHIRNKTIVDDVELFKYCINNNIDIFKLFRPLVSEIKKMSKTHPELANFVFIEQEYVFDAKMINNNENEQN